MPLLIDESNSFAITALEMAANDPTTRPVVVYGPPGSGKTSLLSGYVRMARRRHPERRVVFMSGGEWAARFVAGGRFDGCTDLDSDVVLEELDWFDHRPGLGAIPFS